MSSLWPCGLVLFAVACAATSSDMDAPSGDDGWFLGRTAEGQGGGPASPGSGVPAGPGPGTPGGPRSAELPNLEPPQAAEPVSERQVIYSAALRLVVLSAREAFSSIQAIAKEAGGHLQESDARSITIRVPAETFERVVTKISGLGEVADSSIRASDVTEEMLDLGIRLENARKARERLLEHLAKSDKVEDTLKIEIELTRVTGEIERLEGRLRFMQSQIAMSTIQVELNTTAPERPGSGNGLELPFEWIGRLGDGLLAGTVQGMPKKPRFLAAGPRFDPPAEFVRYYSSSDLVEAMSADDLRLKVQEQENFDEGALAFWSQLARRSLVQSRGVAVAEEQDLGEDRMLIRGTREVGDQSFGYLLVLARTKRSVYTFEAWGPRASFDRRASDLLESAKSLRR